MHKGRLELLAHLELGDTSQIDVDPITGYGYVAHMGQTRRGTSVVDLRNPRRPRVVAVIDTPPGTHSHKAQVLGELLLVNHERNWQLEPTASAWSAGLAVFDVSGPHEPKQIGFFPTPGKGVHRLTFWDEPYAYISASDDGYTDQFLAIVDLSTPTKPAEVGRWWFPGMWSGGGEEPSWPADLRYAAHHAIIRDNIAYCSWWDAGVMIIDISDPSLPTLISHIELDHASSRNTHTALPLDDSNYVLIVDELTSFSPEIPRLLRVFDVSHLSEPLYVTTFPQPSQGSHPIHPLGRYGPHNIHEMKPGSWVDASIVFTTHFSDGLRVWHVSSDMNVAELASYIPTHGAGGPPMTNDVYVNQEGVVILSDRDAGGLDILQFN